MSELVKDDHGTSSKPPVTDRRRRRPMSFTSALLLTVAGALVPGLGLLAAGRRRLGAAVLAVAVAVLAVTAWIGLTQRRSILHWLVQPDTLRLIGIVLPVIGLAWMVVIVLTYRSLRPLNVSPLQRIGGSALVTLLVLVVLTPLAVGGRYAQVQRGVVQDVFAGSHSRSATRPKNVTAADPWAGQDRVNVLLLGGDGGKDRSGIRPDSIQVASIDTRTGNTVLFSLPRNLEKVPFPPGSSLAKAYKGGVYAGPGDQLEWMINSIYRNVPAQHPGLLVSDNPGADATKLAVGQALGLKLDYYVLINLQGFEQLVNALGGITVNINERVAIGGATDEGIKPSGYLHPGPNQHLDGYHALWFARGRYGADDYQRMLRQRCAMKAIIDQANPGTVLTRYEAIAKTSKHIVLTDIPSSLLPAFVDLSMKVKGGDVKSIAFTNKIIKPWNPNYKLIRKRVSTAVAASEKAPPTKKPAIPKDNPNKTAKPKPTPTGNATPNPNAPADSLADACAYRPVQ
ncbi:LCP family protein [Actinopolymorpha rutila]|uniref:LCP family protein required for cell wall assembly n=1 Tax=Actinopolymorpha rutila TaxID=446787 RepID=A0A852ZE36_9ACTN|nr:LCP family protein [Actinopolymorpha rutila]NYH87929.1 LCP family protein required for cell wall assembly [Actinopolymorpha rutila]